MGASRFAPNTLSPLGSLPHRLNLVRASLPAYALSSAWLPCSAPHFERASLRTVLRMHLTMARRVLLSALLQQTAAPSPLAQPPASAPQPLEPVRPPVLPTARGGVRQGPRGSERRTRSRASSSPSRAAAAALAASKTRSLPAGKRGSPLHPSAPSKASTLTGSSRQRAFQRGSSIPCQCQWA
jgi:hypothetical protein